jgi:hypothetical protein
MTYAELVQGGRAPVAVLSGKRFLQMEGLSHEVRDVLREVGDLCAQ